MNQSITISRSEWTQFMKRFAYLEEFVRNSLKTQGRSRWMTPKEAMEEIGCKASKLKELRLNGEIDWRYAGNKRGVMILRKSVEAYISRKSTMLRVA